MLVAEIHNKVIPEARDDEDSFASTVFGHLRYVRFMQFWDRLFQAARTVPIEGIERSLCEIASHLGQGFG